MNTQATQANGLKKAPGVVVATAQGKKREGLFMSNSKLTKRELAGKELFAKGKVSPYMPRVTSEPKPIYIYAVVDGYRVSYEVVPRAVTGVMRCECAEKNSLHWREFCEHLFAVRHFAEANLEALIKQQMLRDVIELASQLEMWAHGKDKEVRNSIVNGYIDEMFN